MQVKNLEVLKSKKMGGWKDFSSVVMFLYLFTGKSKQMEAKMVQKLQEDVNMDEDNWSRIQQHLLLKPYKVHVQFTEIKHLPAFYVCGWLLDNTVWSVKVNMGANK